MSDVLFESKGGIGLVTLNRPEKLNALDGEMFSDLGRIFRQIRDDPAIRLGVLTGAGRAFSTGADLADPQREARGRSSGVAGGSSSGEANLYVFLRGFEKPLIAGCHGYCLAQGAGLALLCDIRVAAEDTMFGWPQVKRGISSVSGPTILSDHVPLGHAMKYVLTGDFMPASEAYRLGLVQEVVPEARLMERCFELAELIAANAPLAVQSVKKALLFSKTTLDFAERVRRAAQMSLDIRQTEDYREGVRAFIEKRKPDFKGR